MPIRATDGAFDTLTVNALGGNDTVDASGLFATNAAQLIRLTVNGGPGNDTLIGSPGKDTFVWNPGDGRDTIEGGDGEDTMTVNGSDLAERFDVSGVGPRALVTRDLDGGTMDLNAIEEIDIVARGGADTIIVNDLTGTAVTRIKLNLAGSGGSAVGDGQADTVIVNGTNRADGIPISGNFNAANIGVVAVGGNTDPSAPPYFMMIAGTEGDRDQLLVNGLGGNDTIDASGVAATNETQLIRLTINGGTGADILAGSPGADTFVWNAGDGIDDFDGRAGRDTIIINGSNLAESFDVSALGLLVFVEHDLDGGLFELFDVEEIDLN